MSADLTIATVEAFHLAIPSVYGGPQPRSGAQWPFVNMVMVRVETRGGLVGWGEAFGHNAAATSRAALATLVAPLAVGAEATDIVGLGARLRRALYTYGLDGPVGFALSGLDIALWDIRGQAGGTPLHRWLAPGSEVREVAAYASLLRYGDAALAGEAAAHAVARGHRAVKLHEATVDAVAAARKAVGPDVPLTLDVNCRWSPDESIANAKLLRPYGLQWLEEPCWPPEPGLLARIGTETGMPIAAGENAGSIAGLERIASARPAYLQPSAAKIGGVTGLLAALDLATRHGIRLATHSAYFGPALAATLHFCAACGLDVEWYDCRLDAWPVGLRPENGRLAVPQRPGLGVEVDAALIVDFEVK